METLVVFQHVIFPMEVLSKSTTIHLTVVEGSAIITILNLREA